MRSLERVQALIARLAPSGICDSCLAESTELERRNDARAIARQLIGSNGYERSNSICCMCRNSRAVTSKTK